jgi:cytochrome b pre-mRNA-processing protein 3
MSVTTTVRVLWSALCRLGVTPAGRLSITGAALDGREMAGLLRFRSLRRPPDARAGCALYREAVALARSPWFYRELGVPDTLDGRFDLIALHVFLLVHRLQDASPPGPSLAQGIFDAMFHDMENNLREIGVSDLSVGRRVRAMWEAFHGRSQVYAAAIGAVDRPALEASLARNVWRGMPPDGAPEALARLMLDQVTRLQDQKLAAFAAGRAQFLLFPVGHDDR